MVRKRPGGEGLAFYIFFIYAERGDIMGFFDWGIFLSWCYAGDEKITIEVWDDERLWIKTYIKKCRAYPPFILTE
jgi:hypothetical protein